MKTSISTFNSILLVLISVCVFTTANAQSDSTYSQAILTDTTTQKLNMDAVYNRPFLTSGKLPVAIGGYLEANSRYASTDGVSDGLSFQMRRMTLFFSSTIAQKIKFFSEIEFEDGTKHINIETALIDIELHSLLNLRGGILMNPIGAFNQNHDGPRWDFIDRPISATTIIPATLSNVGVGLHGKYFVNRWTLGYELYLTNGFDDAIITNTDNRTSLAAGKSNEDKFEFSNSGLPMVTGKFAVRNRTFGEVGISYMSGVYNKYRHDGIVIDDKRTASVIAVDFTTSALDTRLTITGEVAKVYVDVPNSYSQLFASEQVGGYIDLVGTIFNGDVLDWQNSKCNLALRLEYADYNQGNFNETGGNISDHIWAVVPGIAFRPTGSLVMRANYRYEQQTDFLGNPPAKTGVIQFGISSYF
ncbi:MAG: hypothetical protein IPM69_02775 [Ignavibacteria bacterium]|nr:hypothetical protein [Ignavibacteria bacterium]